MCAYCLCSCGESVSCTYIHLHFNAAKMSTHVMLLLQSQGGDIMEVTICMHMDGQAHMYACTHMVFVVKYAYTSAVSTWPCTCTYIGTLGSIT
jgi:hypothetical protein